MMLTKSPSTTPPMPASMPTAIHEAPVDAGGNNQTHADYNLQPLAVPGLDHYVIHIEKSERFHVR
ncbi:hypothetical protein ACFPME_04215 [Rhodanobacter umsongensis]|uniref:Uncharacterized protein n=1 Tax=Rhodanobacter umsongensis TaxID=633153 RepID=A0ABW0JIX3_9GAMM